LVPLFDNLSHYIRNYSGLSKSNFTDHYGNTVQNNDMIAEINVSSVSDKMLCVKIG